MAVSETRFAYSLHDTMNQNGDEFQVRWGDKHGGYGEHYWDYNHAGHVSVYTSTA
jgi:hypothetical protein